MESNGSITFYSREPILKALASIPAEMANRIVGDYYILSVYARPQYYVLRQGDPVAEWEIEVEFNQN
jgi:hypothetical protein